MIFHKRQAACVIYPRTDVKLANAGLKLAIERGWLWLHESGTYVRSTQAGAELFA
jgi:hypothetical protein